MRSLRALALWAALAAVAGCQQLGEVGRAPGFSPVGPQAGAVAAGADTAAAALAGPGRRDTKRGNARASLWESGPASLFGDRRAARLGDILTVVIEIDDKAQISNKSSRKRSGSESLSVPDLVGIPQVIAPHLPDGAGLDPAVGLSSSGASSGEGAVARNEKITLRIAATVTRVLPNGQLVIRGSQEVRVNFELRDLQIAGIVRPGDISRRNEITYDKIAGARISYGGRGRITDVQQPRYGQQIADILLPF
ncbi:MAG: flagellar basal body L-ring protein FlgH [Paracoccaceae bacterium]